MTGNATTNYTQYLSQLNTLINQAVSKYNNTLVISTNITQLISSNVTLNITLKAFNDVGILSTTFILVKLLGGINILAVAPLTNSSYPFNVSQVFVPTPLFTHPLCPMDFN
jgi:hypothetical protein